MGWNWVDEMPSPEPMEWSRGSGECWSWMNSNKLYCVCNKCEATPTELDLSTYEEE